MFMLFVFVFKTVLKRLYEKNKESIDKAVRKSFQNEQSEEENQDL